MDTAVSLPGRGLFVFSGDQLWRYSGWRRVADPGYPKPITAEFPGVFQRDLDAALLHPDGSLYLFRGDQHIRYNLHAGRPELGYPRPYGPDWPGVFPGGVDAAITWAPDIIYLFQGDAYTSFSPRQARARPGYPKPITGNWPGIHGRPVRAIFTLRGDRTLVLTNAPQVLDSEGGPVPGHPDGLPGLLQSQATISPPRGTPLAQGAPVAVDAFPSAYPDPFAADTKLGDALKQAVTKTENRRGQPSGSFPIPFTIAEVTSGAAPFPMAGHLDNEVDYIASEAKVPVMYAAFELRAMVRRFAAANPKIPPAKILSQVAAAQNSLFLRAVPQLNADKNITDVQRRPSYSNVFTASAGGAIDFAKGYAAALHEMIVVSSDADAMTCVHGVGYSYLNGALSAGGFITSSPAAPTGIWVAGDFTFGHGWPYVRGVTSVNDGPAAFAATTRQMARMLALISTGDLVDSSSSGEMAALLGEAAHGAGGSPPPDSPWTSRGEHGIPVANFVLNKLGVGPKGRNHLGSPQFYSEVSLIKDAAAAGHSYVVAWQNLLDTGPYRPDTDMAQLILDTLRAYE